MRLLFRPLVVLITLIGLAACQTEPEAPDYGLQGFNPNAEEQQREVCLKSGGDFRAAGLGARMICFTTPRDAGQACTKATDCDSACLARSRTCAPVQPLIGCNAILDNAGREVTLCVD